ncbi:NuA4 histone acetyltransferase subunit [Coelomomyces lativittatus]|nr:NuA4 histone acetyltransferase subunit [Coelomomyces lativittatus]
MTATFGGDEVSALVLDVGTAWTKAGYAGEDVPDAYFPSSAGYIPSTSSSSLSNSPSSTVSASASTNNDGTWILGDTITSSWKPHMEMRTPLVDGIVKDWEVYEKLWEYTFHQHLRIQPKEHPLLVTEAAWNPKEHRKKIMELALETLDFPAFFLAKNSVMASFAAGRGTSLVIECGAGTTSVVPVYDGYVLTKAMIHQPLAGDMLTWQTQLAYGTHPDGTEFPPQYLIQTKKKASQTTTTPPSCETELKQRIDTTLSFHQLAQRVR